MKIEGSAKPVSGPPSGEGRTRAQPARQEAPAAGAKVELSSLSASMQKAEATMAETPVVDRARVDEIRQAISEGRFKVDANRIADGLIDSVRQMLDARTPSA